MLLFPHITIAFILLTIMLLLYRHPVKQGDKIASIFLFIIGFAMFLKLISIGALKIPMPSMILSINSFPFLYGPLLYLYIKCEIDDFQILKKVNLLHFVPFILATLIILLFPGIMHVQNINIPFNSSNLNTNPNFIMPAPALFLKDIQSQGMPQVIYDMIFNSRIYASDYFFYIFMSVSFILYSALIFRLIQNNIKKNINNDLNTLKDKNYFWLRVLTFCFVFFYLFCILTMLIAHGILNPL